jgi:hypothetical protein
MNESKDVASLPERSHIRQFTSCWDFSMFFISDTFYLSSIEPDVLDKSINTEERCQYNSSVNIGACRRSCSFRIRRMSFISVSVNISGSRVSEIPRSTHDLWVNISIPLSKLRVLSTIGTLFRDRDALIPR